MIRVKISEICEQIRGVSYKPTDVVDSLSGIPILRANNISDDVINYNNLVYIKKERISPKQILKKGDILICTSSGSKNLVGKAGLITKGNFISSFGAFCKVLRAYNTSSEYLFHYFCSDAYRDRISALSAGANINNIKNEHIDTLEIPIYPLDKERNLLKVLNKTKVLISKRKQQLSKLDELAKSRFIEMFGDNHSELVPLEQLCDFIRNGANIRQSKGSGGYPITRIETISNNVFNLDRLGYAGITTLEKYENYILKNGDILVSHINSEKYLGRAVQYKGQQKIIHGMNLLCVRPKETTIATFLEYYLRSNPTKEYISKITKKAVNQASFSVSDYKKLPVMNISKNECMAFNSFIEQIDKSKFRIKKSLEKLELTYKALLQEYFG